MRKYISYKSYVSRMTKIHLGSGSDLKGQENPHGTLLAVTKMNFVSLDFVTKNDVKLSSIIFVSLFV